jgi:hypothetical protein
MDAVADGGISITAKSIFSLQFQLILAGDWLVMPACQCYNWIEFLYTNRSEREADNFIAALCER